MSKKTRGGTKDANRRRERHQRSESRRLARPQFPEVWRFNGSQAAIKRYLRDMLGLADVRVTEGILEATIRICGPRGTAAHASRVQLARAVLAPMHPTGIRWTVIGRRRWNPTEVFGIKRMPATPATFTLDTP